MELKIADRIYIPGILPKKNSYMGYNLKKSIVGKVSITQEEYEKYGIEEVKEEGTIKWDAIKDTECPLVVDFTKEELQYLKNACESLSEQGHDDGVWQTVEKIYSAVGEEEVG